MEQKCIQLIVNSLLEQYKSYGAADASIETYQHGFCGPIIRYCNKVNNGWYSAGVLDDYLSMQKEKLENQKIGKTYYSIFERIVSLIKSVAETGAADFSRMPASKKYNPSQEHWVIADKIVETNKVSSGSVKNLHTQIRHLFCFIEENKVSDKDVTDELFFNFLSSVKDTNKGSMSEIMRAVRLTSAFLKENGSMNLHTDFSLLPIKKATIHMIPPYTQEEIKRIVDAINLDTDMGKRDFAIMLLAFDTGLRGIDIIQLCCQDIDWRKGTLSIRQSKTGDPIIQPLNGTVLNAMADYALEVRPDNGENEFFLSSRPPRKALKGCFSLDNIIEKYCEIAGVEKKPRRSFHSVRRSFATELSLKGVALEEISELLGHRDLRSDKPYLSYDRKHVSFIAADFTEIPIRGGIYAKAFTESKGGGVA